MAALDGAPGVVLGRAELGLLGRVPADGGGVEQHAGALERGEPGRLRIPLVPAHQRAHPAEPGRHGLEAKVARSEIELLVEQRVVGDVHLAVDARQRPVRLEDHQGVVVEARGPALEQRGQQDDAATPGDLREPLGGGAGDRFGQVEQRHVLALAEVLGLEQLG